MHSSPHRCFTPLLLTVSTLAVLAPAAFGREFGVDVSHYQGSTGIPQTWWTTMAASGGSFAVIKASEGLTGPDDAAMANNVARAGAAGVVTGVYHFPHAENRPTVAGAVQEADHFMAYAGDAIGPGHLRPVLDLEGNSLLLSTTALTDWVLAFVDEVVAVKGPAAEPIIYASRSTAMYELDSRVAGLDLWLAYWNAGVDPATAEPPPTVSWPVPTGQFGNWVMWQYASTASLAGISPLDVDVIHSEYKPLAALIIPEPTTILTLLPFLTLRPQKRGHS
jgi:GH25 family lysozyme M1 (1,4-beta-N-acetylmuramidase)